MRLINKTLTLLMIILMIACTNTKVARVVKDAVTTGENRDVECEFDRAALDSATFRYLTDGIWYLVKKNVIDDLKTEDNKGHNYFYSKSDSSYLRFQPDGKHIIGKQINNEIFCWDYEKNREQLVWCHPKEARHLYYDILFINQDSLVLRRWEEWREFSDKTTYYYIK